MGDDASLHQRQSQGLETGKLVRVRIDVSRTRSPTWAPLPLVHHPAATVERHGCRPDCVAASESRGCSDSFADDSLAELQRRDLLSAIRCEHGRMTSWRDVERGVPDFAQRVRALFNAHRHKTIATLRADGSPRISGIEAVFEDGELVFGSMPNARKGADLRRDPRFALHSATVDPVDGSEAQWPGEAKISGRAIAAGPTTHGADGDRFHADIAEVVHTHLNDDATILVVEWWTPTHGLRKIERK